MIDVPPGDRPREKLERAGSAALGDNELMALVLGHGSARAGALSLANEILAAAGGVHGLTRLHRAQLAALPGVGPALASRVLAAVELGRRTLTHSPPERPQLLSGRACAEYLAPLYGAHPVEQFGVVLLDTRRRVLATRVISTGLVDASMAHPREVFREAVIASAAAVVVFHNHPSGDPTPSQDDLALTRRLVGAGEVVGIEMVDHVILGDVRYCSMRERTPFLWHG